MHGVRAIFRYLYHAPDGLIRGRAHRGLPPVDVDVGHLADRPVDSSVRYA